MAERLTDENWIDLGIWDAEAEGGEIDKHTARLIASQLHGGQASALYLFASSGFVDRERAEWELKLTQRDQPELAGWIGPLLGYLAVDRSNDEPF